jgi:HEPN domain-containing protein
MEREIMILNRWEQGRSSIDKLLSQGRLERIEPNRDHAYALIEQARRATSSASVLSATEDTIAAFNAAYDAARKALTAILVNEGLRPGGGEGGHAVLREAVLAQLEPPTQLW